MAEANTTRRQRLASLQLDSLAKILNFNDSASPALVETRDRVIDTARKKGPGQAEAVVATYQKIAEEALEEQLDPSRRNAPRQVREQEITKARGGLLISIARIWRDAGVPDKCLEALDRAIDFAKQNRWASVVTRLESEKQKLIPSGT